MTPATRTSHYRLAHGRHRPGPHPHGQYARRRERRVRRVLGTVLLLAGLASALYSQLGSFRDPAGPHTAAAAAPMGVPGGQPGMPMLDVPTPAPSMPMTMPGMTGAPAASPSSGPAALVPPETPLYTAPPQNDAPLSAADRDFLVRVRQAGLWEGPAGQQAQARSQNPLVKEAGQHMVAGHAELDAKVLAIGKQLSVPLPWQPSDAQRGWLAEMAEATTPQDFDKVFANRLRAAHGQVFALVAQVRADTRNSIIRAFAQRVLEVVLDHMTMLERTGLVDYGKLPQPTLLPGAVNTPTVPTPSGPLTAADRDFLVRVRLAGLWEGPSGRLSQQRTHTSSVRTAGQHLVSGHAELDAKVLALGRELNVDLPTEPNRDQKTWLGEMTAAGSQQAFDQVFVDRLRAAHGTVFGYVAAVRADTANNAIRDFTVRTMQVVLDHITVLERTGLVHYDALPQPVPLPSPVAAAARPAAGGGTRSNIPSGGLRYLVGSMLLIAAAVTVVARRDLVHRKS